MDCKYDIVLTRPVPSALEPELEGLRYTVAKGPDWWSAARAGLVVIDWFRPVTRDMLRDPGCVRLIIARSAGYDYIDTEAAERAGLCVANQPEIIDEAVAELAVAGVLAALRRVAEGHLYINKWHESGWPSHLRGSLLLGRRIGFLGAGRIAHSILYKILPYHPSEILYYSRSPKPGFEQLAPARPASLEELFQESEVLFNTLPLTRETRGIVGLDLLLSMPRGAVYVNVGRGATEEPGAIEEAKRRRPDLHLVLDVHPEEPIPPGSPRLLLARESRVVMTPHFAGYSLESQIGTTLLAIRQAKNYLQKGCAWNPVAGPCKPCMSGKPSLAEAIALARSLSQA